MGGLLKCKRRMVKKILEKKRRVLEAYERSRSRKRRRIHMRPAIDSWGIGKKHCMAEKERQQVGKHQREFEIRKTDEGLN